MHFDFSSVDDVESYITVPEGVHHCRIAEVREGRARDGSVRWSFRLEVMDGDYAGRTAAWDSFTWSERGVYRVKKVLAALGLDVRGELEIDSADLVNLEARVKVEPEEREDPVTGRRQVRMRVPYLGYAAADTPGHEDGSTDATEVASANGTESEGGSHGKHGTARENGSDEKRRKGSARHGDAPASKRESLAPVDGWRATRESADHDAEDTRDAEHSEHSGNAEEEFSF
jgi:hypothetical protein